MTSAANENSSLSEASAVEARRIKSDTHKAYWQAFPFPPLVLP